ncbi:MAG TPA: phosphate ABC transporter ATP-binding protein [Firmicutes bacterium]|nr:phosphate ABC transporter ATP-binding protein [Bacillota bacterium]
MTGAGQSGAGSAAQAAKVVARNFKFWYGQVPALQGIDLEIGAGEQLTIMGPTGSGKTTFLRCLNRLNDLVPGTRREGQLLIGGEDIYGPGRDPDVLRRRVGMVFALPIPLPMSIFDNVAFGPRVHGVKGTRLTGIVEQSLRGAALWEEVKDRLGDSAFSLSGGQQQRLAIARVLAMEPEIILLDEPCSGLDPISTLRVEELVGNLRGKYTIVFVTHNPQQAARLGGNVAFFYLGKLVECGPARQLFTRPQDQRTEDYISGRFG